MSVEGGIYKIGKKKVYLEPFYVFIYLSYAFLFCFYKIYFSEQKVIQYEQYVRNLQAHNRAIANCQEAPNGISYQDLQQEVSILIISTYSTYQIYN